MKRNFPPVKRDALEGWNQCLDLRPQQRKQALKEVVRDSLDPSKREWASGWMDAWDTFGMADWDEIKKRTGPRGQIKSALLSLDEFRSILASDESDDVDATGPVKKVIKSITDNPKKQFEKAREPR